MLEAGYIRFGREEDSDERLNGIAALYDICIRTQDMFYAGKE